MKLSEIVNYLNTKQDCNPSQSAVIFGLSRFLSWNKSEAENDWNEKYHFEAYNIENTDQATLEIHNGWDPYVAEMSSVEAGPEAHDYVMLGVDVAKINALTKFVSTEFISPLKLGSTFMKSGKSASQVLVDRVIHPFKLAKFEELFRKRYSEFFTPIAQPKFADYRSFNDIGGPTMRQGGSCSNGALWAALVTSRKHFQKKNLIYTLVMNLRNNIELQKALNRLNIAFSGDLRLQRTDKTAAEKLDMIKQHCQDGKLGVLLQQASGATGHAVFYSSHASIDKEEVWGNQTLSIGSLSMGPISEEKFLEYPEVTNALVLDFPPDLNQDFEKNQKKLKMPPKTLTLAEELKELGLDPETCFDYQPGEEISK